jgi:hypothetical protein
MRRSKAASAAGQACGQIRDAVSMREFPAEVKDRAVPEGDVIMGSGNSHIRRSYAMLVGLCKISFFNPSSATRRHTIASSARSSPLTAGDGAPSAVARPSCAGSRGSPRARGPHPEPNGHRPGPASPRCGGTPPGTNFDAPSRVLLNGYCKSGGLRPAEVTSLSSWAMPQRVECLVRCRAVRACPLCSCECKLLPSASEMWWKECRRLRGKRVSVTLSTIGLGALPRPEGRVRLRSICSWRRERRAVGSRGILLPAGNGSGGGTDPVSAAVDPGNTRLVGRGEQLGCRVGLRVDSCSVGGQ